MPELEAGARAMYEDIPAYKGGKEIPWEKLRPGYRESLISNFAVGLAAIPVSNAICRAMVLSAPPGGDPWISNKFCAAIAYLTTADQQEGK